MKDKKLRSFFVLLIILLSILLGCISQKPDLEIPHIQINSDDGNAFLNISELALPTNVDKNSISVTKISSDDILIEFENGSEAVGYKLEPDGLSFNENISLNINVGNTNGSFPIFFHVDNENISIVNDVEYNLIDNNISVSIPISHFSEIYYHPLNYPKVTPEKFFEIAVDIPDTDVADTVEGTIEIKANYIPISVKRYTSSSKEYYTESSMWLKKDDPSQRLEDGIISVEGPLIPDLVKDKPGHEYFSDKIIIETNDFKCEKIGKANMSYSAVLYWAYEWKNAPIGGVGQGSGGYSLRTLLRVETCFQCQEKISEIIVTDKVAEEVSIGGYKAFICKWHLFADESEKLSWDEIGDMPYGELTAPDGSNYSGLFLIIENRSMVEGHPWMPGQYEGTAEHYRYVTFKYGCSHLLGSHVGECGYGQDGILYFTVLLMPWETVTVSIGDVAEEWFTYSGTGDPITITRRSEDEPVTITYSD